MLLCYFHVRFSVELYFLIPPAQTNASSTHGSDHRPSLRIPLERKTFKSGQDFLEQRRAHYQIIKSLKNGGDIYITKPGKSSSVIIINIQVILNDSSKFHKTGLIHSCDNTIKIETRVKRSLLPVYMSKVLSQMVYVYIRPVESQRSCMYSVPKVHEKGTPPRPFRPWQAPFSISWLNDWLDYVCFSLVFLAHFCFTALLENPIYVLRTNS